MMLNQMGLKNIENVVIFVCDSLRWDYTPQSIIDMGVSVKTVASSLYTASSFPSMISGLYPPKTGVHTWEDVLPKELRGLLNIDEYNSSLWCETTWTNLPPDKSAIHKILGNPKGISLEDIKPPFIFVEDDKGGHCPFGFSFEEYMGKGCPEFFKEYGKKGKKELINQYKIGIEKSVEQFKKRLKILENRGLVENTLVIFTSDHGELLGEYGGLTYHNRPPCPELVYVPTIFIHPLLKPEFIKNKIISHVDIYPTIASILNKNIDYKVDGVDLTNNFSNSTALNFKLGGYFKSKSKINKWFNYGAKSMWDYYGGHIFHSLGSYRGYMLFLYKIIIQKHPEFNYLISNLRINPNNRLIAYKQVTKHLASPYLKYLKPNFSKNEAKDVINKYLQSSENFIEMIRIKSSIRKLKKIKKINLNLEK